MPRLGAFVVMLALLACERGGAPKGVDTARAQAPPPATSAVSTSLSLRDTTWDVVNEQARSVSSSATPTQDACAAGTQLGDRRLNRGDSFDTNLNDQVAFVCYRRDTNPATQSGSTYNDWTAWRVVAITQGRLTIAYIE